MSRLSEEFVAEFGELMTKELHMTSGEFFNGGKQILEKHKLLKQVKQILPKYFLTHQENRNRLMLNGRNVHKKGQIIYSIGADRKMLSTAVCVELAPMGPTRISNLEANAVLIQRSDGLLAPINGEETFLTLGCGHTTAFCKVAPLAGITPEKGLQDESGKMDYSKLCKQAEFKAMFEQGWDWEVIPWDVDQMFPKFAKVVQKALNGSNSATTEIGELDTAVNLADLQHESNGKPDWEKLALKSVGDMCMSCAPYAHTILDFVKLYGGGPGAPHITFMDIIGKTFNSTMVLGATYWHALTYTQFYDKTCMFPLLRVGLALVNLVTDKHDDRIAKCLCKSDISKIAGKAYADKAKQAEYALTAGMDIVDTLNQSGTSKNGMLLQPLGHFFVRTGLWLTGKGKDGPEGKEYSMDEVKQMFLLSVCKEVGHKINYPAWNLVDSDVSPPEEPASSQAKPTAAASLHDHNSPTWIAASKGFEIGKMISENKVEMEDGQPIRFEITSIDDATSTIWLKQVVFYNVSEPSTGKVQLVDLLANWSVLKMEVPKQAMILRDLRSSNLAIDAQKAKIFLALLEADTYDDEVVKSLCFWRKPDHVRTGDQQIPKGKLVLASMNSMSSIGIKPGGLPLGIYEVNGIQQKFFGSGPSKPAVDCDKVDDMTIVAFWWVATTPDKALANMRLEHVTVSGGMKVPVLKNTQVIKPFSKLLKFQAAAAAMSTSLQLLPEEGEPAKKKRKSS